MYTKYPNTERSYMFLAKISPQPDNFIKTHAKLLNFGKIIQNLKLSKLHSSLITV